MTKAYSADIRERVLKRVESGASRREAAEHFEISASPAGLGVKCFNSTRLATEPLVVGRSAAGRGAGEVGRGSGGWGCGASRAIRVPGPLSPAV